MIRYLKKLFTRKPPPIVRVAPGFTGNYIKSANDNFEKLMLGQPVPTLREQSLRPGEYENLLRLIGVLEGRIDAASKSLRVLSENMVMKRKKKKKLRKASKKR